MSWEMVKLGDIVKLVTGKTPPTSVNEYFGGNVLWVTPADFKSKYIRETVRTLTDVAIDHKKCNLIPKNSIVLNCIGDIGKVSILEKEGCTNQQITSLIPKSNVRIDFLYYSLLRSKKALSNLSNAAVVPIINNDRLKTLQIQLPPLSTQKRIAEILDKADALRKADQQLLKYYDDLAQSLFIDLFGDPVKNEKGWEVKKLGELGNWKSGGTPTRSNPKFFKGNIPWLSSGELNNMFISESIESITEDAIQNSSTSLIPINSLLLGMYDTAALKSSINKVVLSCNQAIAFSQLDKKISNVIFVYYLIRIGKEEFKKAQRGVRQKNLNLSLIKDIKTIHPPISLQNQFATQIQNIEQQKEKLKVQIQASEHLFQSLLKQAFNGGLN